MTPELEKALEAEHDPLREKLEALVAEWRRRAHAQESLSVARNVHLCADELEAILKEK
jgi:hypothetical protein